MDDDLRRHYLRARFDTAAEDYQRTRPVCPPQLFDDLIAVAELAPGDRLIEIGCGTGQATVPRRARAGRHCCGTGRRAGGRREVNDGHLGCARDSRLDCYRAGHHGAVNAVDVVVGSRGREDRRGISIANAERRALEHRHARDQSGLAEIRRRRGPGRCVEQPASPPFWPLDRSRLVRDSPIQRDHAGL